MWSSMVIRRLAMAVGMTCGLAGTGAAQQSITASATILERVEAGAVEVEVRSAGSRLSVRQTEGAGAISGTRLLRSTFVQTGGGVEAVEPGAAVRGGDGSIVGLERRTMGVDGTAPEELLTGGRLLIDMTDQLTITRVVASNS
jgi:hypothetical protein